MSTTFDLRAPLPGGRLVIEASAGTGKTYVVAGLVARALIETDRAPDTLLVTTFTRAAASELRQRIRSRLVDAVRLLDGSAVPPADDLVAHALLATDGAGRTLRLSRARTAVAEFESLTIGTIHSLCQRILRIAGQDVTLDEDSGNATVLLDEVINDLVVREAAAQRAGIDVDRLRSVAAVAVDNPKSRLYVASGADGLSPELSRAHDLVQQVLRDVRARQARQLSFDALLARAHALVTDPADHGVRDALGQRFSLAIVDEAQDTDPLQWELLQALFPVGETARTLIVVGDPKQSIYAFRGADVDGYVRTRGEGATERTLGTNFRSDQPLLAALNALFGAYAFGEGIAYLPVQAAPDRQTSPVALHRPVLELLVTPDRRTGPVAQAAARRVAALIAAETWTAPQIAVLVGSRHEGAAVATELARLGVPAVTSGTSSVATATAATELRNLFRAIQEPGHTRVLRLAALGWFGDLAPADLLGEDSDRLLPFQEQLPERRAVLSTLGVAALIEQLLLDRAVIDRMAATGHLARHLTDLAHLSELLHEVSGGRATHAAAMRTALQRLATLDEKSELVTRRIESDAAAVQILTIHAAKGLEFPCVVVAKLWGDSSRQASSRVPHARLDPADPTSRAIDVGYCTKQFGVQSKESFLRALQAEDDRLFYVAMTRAQHELIVVVPLIQAGNAPVTGRTTAPMRCFGIPEGTPDVDGVRGALRARLADADHRVRITALEDVLAESPPQRPPPPEVTAGELATAPPPGVVLAPFRHWSFTVATSRRTRVELPDERGGEDEFGAEDSPTPSALTAPGALVALPAGADVGTVLHALFEHLDFAASDPAEALAPLLARFAQGPALRDHHEAITRGVLDVLRTPLGNGPPLDLCLADVTRADRMDELRFDLALPDDAALPLTRIGELLATRLAHDDPLRGYAERLAAGALPAALRGMLTGAIDLVLRHPRRPEHLLIVDYKSNRLPAYDAATVLASMLEHHYPLQGLLYSVAVHRWLRWRTGEPDPSPRLGGFAHLYLRGLTGPGTPTDAGGRRAGVFHWQAPPGVIPALSDLLARESRA